MGKLSWKPWHEVVKLRDDLKTGELPLHMFAADLYEVLMQSGKRPIYEKSENFFALTFPTTNLRRLVREVILRLLGKNDKAVRQLELTYGGGKTHTLITLRHLVHDPEHLPTLPAVAEFTNEIRQQPPRCRVAGLCFDKLDVEKGLEVIDPSGNRRILREPWSVLAYQIAGDDGLRLLNADGKPEERGTAPAENLLTQLLEIPTKQGLGILILIDEVLMYAREKVGTDEARLNSLTNFFQYLTQAATKVDRCCIVASLLTSEPTNEDQLGRRIKGKLYDIFQRQREEAIEPVLKEDIAEVLRRRFFTPDSILDPGRFRQHVIAALKGIESIDDLTAKQPAEAEERFLKSYPFHPDLTEVLYGKWTQLDRFQRTRGVLRTFALALREAEKWDDSPLVGPVVLLTAPDKNGLSEALGELVAVADTEEWEGKKQAWTGILDTEFQQARTIQDESVGLKFREIEQAVVSTFLHSQPIGQTAKTRDLMVLLGATHPDRIELEKGLAEWAQRSYWLDDAHAGTSNGKLPATWRLGNRPNLNQMHAVEMRNFSDGVVGARLVDEIPKVKALSADASGAGVKVHTLPTKPRDIEDDGNFHYAILSPSCASDSGKPSPEAKRFIDDTTSSDRPRVNRNAVILLTPSKDGLELALARVREYLAWEAVSEDVKKQQKDGNVDPARAATLAMNISTSRNRIPDAIRQAYCIVVTVNEKDDVSAFKIQVTDETHFKTIKNDKRSRIQDTAIAADALLAGGPYSLWKEGETSRRVKDLSGAFAQYPHLPKMLKSKAVLDTFADGCEQGYFVLRLMRPDKTVRTWWMQRPDEVAMNDPALELCLSEAAELTAISPDLLVPKRLPELWKTDEVNLKDVIDYFHGGKRVRVEKNGYAEEIQVPKASREVVEKAVVEAVEKGYVWLVSGPASIFSEPMPPGILNDQSTIYPPLPTMPVTEILQENIPSAWKNEECTALSALAALSSKAGKNLPWKVIQDLISSAMRARFIELVDPSIPWPTDFPHAEQVRFRMTKVGAATHPGAVSEMAAPTAALIAESELSSAEIQNFGDVVGELFALKAKHSTPIKITVRVELGDGKTMPSDTVAGEFNRILKNVKDGFSLK